MMHGSQSSKTAINQNSNTSSSSMSSAQNASNNSSTSNTTTTNTSSTASTNTTTSNSTTTTTTTRPNATTNLNIDVPVRILVPSESVGAIIGKGGQTIRQLTQQTRAKVDVYRGDPMSPSNALQEKVITIRGQPENCINACREILKVMKEDAESKGKPVDDMPLKILAHNDYIGRIIGKQGNIINTIKKETDTTVTVSSVNDMSMNVERVITVKGELENMIKALEIIHTKVKLAFENDTKAFGAQKIIMNSIPPMPLVPPQLQPHQMPLQLSMPTQSIVPSSGYLPPAVSSNGSAYNPSRYVGPSTPGAAPQVPGSSAATAPAATTTNYSGYYPPPLYHHSHVISATTHSVTGNASGAHTHQPHHASNMYQSGTTAAGSNTTTTPPATTPVVSNSTANTNGAPAQSSQPANSAACSTSSLGNNHQADLQNGFGHMSLSNSPSMTSNEMEKVFLYIPNVAVGAIIGTKGSFIKNIIKMSGASVKITPLSPEESKVAVERQVSIVGLPDSQCKAQYYIYEKIRQERYTTDDNVKLRVEIQVPSHLVGRIIGKAGKNVRELQRITGATIKLPDESSLSKEHEGSSCDGAVGDAVNGTMGHQESSNESEANKRDTETTTESNNREDHAEPKANESNNEKNNNEKVNNEEGETETSTTQAANADANEENGQKQHQQQQNNQHHHQNHEASGDYVTVRVFGTYNASQLAQRRIQSLISYGSSTTLLAAQSSSAHYYPPAPSSMGFKNNNYLASFNHATAVTSNNIDDYHHYQQPQHGYQPQQPAPHYANGAYQSQYYSHHQQPHHQAPPQQQPYGMMMPNLPYSASMNYYTRMSNANGTNGQRRNQRSQHHHHHQNNNSGNGLKSSSNLAANNDTANNNDNHGNDENGDEHHNHYDDMTNMKGAEGESNEEEYNMNNGTDDKNSHHDNDLSVEPATSVNNIQPVPIATA